jgi:DNA-binding NarL/FixJ family response regulator
MTEQTEIRIFVVDDHELIRFAMESWIRQESNAAEAPTPHLRVVGTSSNAEEALRELGRLLGGNDEAIQPNFLLIDYQLPDALGSEVIQKLRAQGFTNQRLPALVMTGMENAPVKDILQSGANGYISKEETSGAFLSAIRRLARNPDDLWLNPAEAKRMLSVERSLTTAGITAAEKNILRLLNLTNEEIAEVLNISRGTVKNHLNNIYQKLGVNSRQEAVDFAKSVGFLPKL